MYETTITIGIMKQSIIILLVCLGFASCTTIGHVSMESLYPSELSFPPEIKSVGIVDNTVFHDTLLKEHVTAGLIEGNGKLLANDLAGLLADGDYFDDIILCDSSLRNGDQQMNEVRLTPEKVSQLLSDLQVDMLITVDGLCVKTWEDIQLFEGVGVLSAVAGEVSSVLSVYLPNRKEPLSIGVQDTLYWPLVGGLTEEGIVADMASEVAARTVKYFIPQWKPENRVFYAGGNVDLRDAAVYVNEQNWEMAHTLWQRQYKSAKPDSRKKIWAAFNMALYHEMNGNIDEAVKYAKEANELAKSRNNEEDKTLTTYYLSGQLENKVMRLRKLDLQMNRFKESGQGNGQGND